MIRSLFLIALISTPVWAEPVRVVVSIGSNYGRPDDVVLQHAEADAVRVRELFVELGNVEPSRAVVLSRPTASQVRERFAEVTGRIAELTAAGRQVQLFVFATSHGTGGVLHLTGSDLPVSELRALAKQTKAGLRVVIVDACEAGLRLKGARRGPAYALSLEQPEATGDVFIASSGAHESAQEWESLSGSLFTHHLLAALRGDADFNSDGRVSLMEAYGYAERRTVADSVDVGQHPQFEVGLSGAAEVSLTEPTRGRARINLEERLEGRFVIVSQPRPDIVLELKKARGRVVSIAVPPGRYVIRQSRGFSLALEEVELPFGGSALVDGSRFVTRDFKEVALKGGHVEFHPHALRFVGALISAPVLETPVRWALSASYRLALGLLWVMGDVAWGSSPFRASDGLVVTDHRVTGRLSSGARVWLGPVVVWLGGVVEGSLLHQSFVRPREDEIRRNYPALAPRLTGGFGIGPRALIDVPVVGPLFVTGGASALLRALPVEGAAPLSFGADLELGVGVRL